MLKSHNKSIYLLRVFCLVVLLAVLVVVADAVAAVAAAVVIGTRFKFA